MITQDRLRELFNYNSETGLFTWRIQHNNRRRAGSEAGWWNKGYRYLTVDYSKIFAHRAAWLYVYGEMPSAHVDHIDGDPSNNRIANLRLATREQNLANRGKTKRNKSGFKGVFWHAQCQKWASQITKSGKTYHVGLFESPSEAHVAYCELAKKLHGEFARGA